MKKVLLICLLLLGLTACGAPKVQCDVAATTAPVAYFAGRIAEGTDVQIAQVITDSVSCLHDYSLSVRQMETVASAKLVLCSGAGLEDFMEDTLRSATVADCSETVTLLGEDPHIWLDPGNAAIMAENICKALTGAYPDHAETFRANTDALQAELTELKAWGTAQLSNITTNKIITCHDGFGYLASSFGLEILASVEEEAGSEASAADLSEMIGLVQTYNLPCVFTEVNGSGAAASAICAETGISSYALDTAMSGDYFEAMRYNITTLKEALQ